MSQAPPQAASPSAAPLADDPASDGGESLAGLMALAQAGDERAYRRLLTAILPLVRALARRSLKTPEDAEDAVQEVLLTLHRVRHTYEPSRPFLPWLFAISRRRIIDRMRLVGRARRRETPLAAEHETFAQAETNMSSMSIDVRALRAALNELTPAEKRALELLKLKELSLKEASAISGLSVPSLKVATHRAIRRLRGVLGSRDGKP